MPYPILSIGRARATLRDAWPQSGFARAKFQTCGSDNSRKGAIMRIDETNPLQPGLGLSPQSAPPPRPRAGAAAILTAAEALLPYLERGQALDAAILRTAMTQAFGASDTEGAWAWKDAYEACEAALVLFLRKYLPAMRSQAADPAALLPMLANIAALVPTHTKRTEDSQQFQQFSTPIELAAAACFAAQIIPDDLVLEPSAGTGLLAIFADTIPARLALNELAATRADLLAALFPKAALSRFNAEQIHDYLPRHIAPSVVLMNPPFSAQANVKGSVGGIDLRHIRSALTRLIPGGRLVAITSANAFTSNSVVPDEIARHGRVIQAPRHKHRNTPDRHRSHGNRRTLRSCGIPQTGGNATGPVCPDQG
jgi:predicted RNA methylase